MKKNIFLIATLLFSTPTHVFALDSKLPTLLSILKTNAPTDVQEAAEKWLDQGIIKLAYSKLPLTSLLKKDDGEALNLTEAQDFVKELFSKIQSTHEAFPEIASKEISNGTFKKAKLENTIKEIKNDLLDALKSTPEKELLDPEIQDGITQHLNDALKKIILLYMASPKKAAAQFDTLKQNLSAYEKKLEKLGFTTKGMDWLTQTAEGARSRKNTQPDDHDLTQSFYEPK
jgi:hypothetical protein